MHLHTRRRFLRTSVLGGALAASLPGFVHRTFAALDAAAADSATQIVTGKDSPIVVILQLAGGNDGLNTVIPFADDAYHRARPKLAIPAKEVLRVSDHLGLNPRLAGLASLISEGHGSIVQGVGYPNPNRSHFRSTEIWQRGSVDPHEIHGWVGRYFDACCSGEDPTVGVAISRTTPAAFAGPQPLGITLESPERFRIANDPEEFAAELARSGQEAATLDTSTNDGGSIAMLDGSGSSAGSTYDFIDRVALDTRIASDRIAEITRKHQGGTDYPSTPLARQLQLIGQLIAGGMTTRVYYANQGGFDTHAGQGGRHDQLLNNVDEAITAFVADLKQQGNFDRVLLMTFSEFGRRVAENTSGGTDHGAAAPLFVVGGGVQGGLFGQTPSLTDLDNGDLRYNTDFRSVYASVLEDWLQTPSLPILGRKYPKIPLV